MNKLDKSKKKSKYRITTLHNFYRPKKLTLYTYNRFMRQFIDKRTFGVDKLHFHTTDFINNCLKSSSFYIRKLCEIPFLYIKTHIYNEKKILYYTNSSHTNIPLFAMDVDALENTTPEDIQKVAEFLSSLHPNSYYEPSSYGKGLHFYFFVDFTGYREAFGKQDWALKANDIMQNNIMSYGKIIKEYVNNNFNVKFDAVKATISHYYYSEEHSCYLIDNQAVLCKLPKPKTEEDALKLFNTPIYSIGYLAKNAEWIINQLIKQDNWKDEKLKTALEEKKKKLSINSSSSLLSSFPVTIGKSFSSNEPQCSNNKDKEPEHGGVKCEHLMQSSNAEKRYIGSIMALSHTLGYLPSVEQWYSYYIKKGLYTGSSGLTEIRKERFDRCLKYVSQTFDPSINSSYHNPLEYIEDLEKRISLEELKQCCKKTGYKYKINYLDLDMGAGYVYMACMSNQKMGLELTVPTRGWINYYKYHKENGTIKRLCTKEKIRAVKLALTKIGYIVCLDNDYDFGCSMRYGLGSNHPKYSEYQLFCKKAETEVLNKKVKTKKKAISPAL